MVGARLVAGYLHPFLPQFFGKNNLYYRSYILILLDKIYVTPFVEQTWKEVVLDG
jgi:hypothetical protein